ncbi:MAG TPA: orotidine-5'-phosphate decarboxylase, partial [Ilumatobacteraceae bacterium]
CVGLDPDPHRMPAAFRSGDNALFEFCRAIVDATADTVCAFKPQFAYFAAQRAEPQLERLCAYIRDSYPKIVLILDAKRGDIGPTAEQYAIEVFDRYGADAVTVNPYLGTDSIEPYLRYSDRGAFVLCRTSNVGGGDFQALDVGGEPLFARVARRAATEWSSIGECGLVVGATYPEELGTVRSIVADMPVLVPGVGAQGGDIAATVAHGATASGFGLVINSSRAVLYASADTDFEGAARREAITTRDAIRRAAENQQVSASTEMMPAAPRS